MATQRIAGKYKSAAGTILVGLGIFILYKSLGCELAGLRHSLCVNGCDALGTVPALALMSGRALHSFATDRLDFLLGVLRQMALTLWPLLLTKAGMLMAQNSCTESATTCSKK
jgi:hypothetical protein